MWPHHPVLPRALLPLCAALVAFRYRHHLLRLCRAMVPWKGWETITDPLCEEQLLCRYVLKNSVHGQPESVLQTFNQWILESEQGHEGVRVCSNLLGPEKGVFMDDVVARAAPSVVLELGTYCGYSAVRILRLLPPGGKLYTVEQHGEVADMAEEMILVAGFKNIQFQLLTLPSEEAISTLKRCFGVDTLDLVLMDHSPGQYLADLRSLEEHGLLSMGATILANDAESTGAREFLHEVQNDRHYRIQSRRRGMLEVVYTREPVTSPA